MSQMQLIDIKGILGSRLVQGVSKQVNTYEKKVRGLVKDLDLRTRDAREKSQKQLDKFAVQVKKTRSQLETRLVEVVNQEAVRLNKGFSELVTYLKSLANNETLKTATRSQTSSSTKVRRNAKSAKTTQVKSKKKKSAGSRSRSAQGELPGTHASA